MHIVRVTLVALATAIAGTLWAVGLTFASATSHTLEPIAWPPISALAPIDELRMQAAIADFEWIDHDSALLKRRLYEIRTRTALEDTARLHFDLG